MSGVVSTPPKSEMTARTPAIDPILAVPRLVG
jgi:hypothetical protein